MDAKLSVAAVGAWLLVAVYYFYQYALRSAPSVMMPELTEAFGVNALGVSAIVGMFYYGYSPFSLLAGAAIDRFGAKRIVPIGAALVGIGALLFGTGNVAAANVGRFLQGAGGVFALVGAVYLITKNFPASLAASFIGATADVRHGRRVGGAVFLSDRSSRADLPGTSSGSTRASSGWHQCLSATAPAERGPRTGGWWPRQRPSVA